MSGTRPILRLAAAADLSKLHLIDRNPQVHTVCERSWLDHHWKRSTVRHIPPACRIRQAL